MLKIPRRKFLQISGLTGLSMAPFIAFVKNLYGEDVRMPPVTLRFIYFRPADLLALEFELVNLTIKDNVLRTAPNTPAYIKVKLPPQHKAEQGFKVTEKNQLPDENNAATSVLANPSWLVFSVKDRMAFTTESLLNWCDNNFMRLMAVNKPADAYIKPSGNDLQITDKLDHNIPFTTLELPAGMYLSPYTDKNQQITFTENNQLINAPEGKDFATLRGEMDEWFKATYANHEVLDSTRYIRKPGNRLRHGKPGTPYKINSNKLYILWNNGMVKTEGKLPKSVPHFKLIDVSAFSVSANVKALPSPFDKNLLSRQFRAKSDAIKGDQEFIQSSAQRFLLTGLGGYVKMAYESTDINAIVQKWVHEMVLGRDQYVEIHRLGFMYPFGHLLAEVEVSQRINEDGQSYMQRWRCIKKIKKSISYRQPSDEAGKTIQEKMESVLFPRKDYAENAAMALKRAFPYSSLEIVTETSDRISFVEDDLDSILARKNKGAELGKIETALKKLVDDYIKQSMPDINQLLSELKTIGGPNRTILSLDIASWIQALIYREKPLLAEDLDKVFQSPLQDYVRYLIFLADFTSMLEEIGKQEMPVKDSPLVKSLAAKAKAFSTIINKDITQGIIALYDTIPDQSISNFRITFKEIGEKLPDGYRDYLSSQNATTFDDYCNKLEMVINATPARARDLYSTGTERFFNNCLRWIENGGMLTPEEQKKSQRNLDNFRQKNSCISAFANPEVDNINDLILAYWPRKQGTKTGEPGEEILFEFEGIDWDGNKHRFKAPFIFVRADALLQTDQLINGASTKLAQQSPVNIQSVNQKLSLANVQQWLNDEGNNINNYLERQKQESHAILAKTDQEIGQFTNDYRQALSGMYEYLQVSNLMDSVHGIDDTIRTHYNRASNQALRRINMAQQQVAFYRRELADKAGNAEEGITSLQTSFIEFGAAGMAQLKLLGKQLPETAETAMSHFKEIARTTLPKVSVASVTRPLSKEFSDAKTMLIGYNDAFVQAGLERLSKAEKDVHISFHAAHVLGRENTEKILYEVKEYGKQAEETIKDFRNNALAEVKRQQDLLKTLTVAQKADLAALLDRSKLDARALMDYPRMEVVNYAKGQMTGLLSGAGRHLGGAFDPSPTISALSTMKNSFYQIENEVNQFTGQVTNAVKVVQEDVNSAINDVQHFNDPRVIEGFLKRILPATTIFGVDLAGIINPETIQPHSMPGTKITKIFRDGIPVGAEVSYSWQVADQLLQETDNFKHGLSLHDKSKPSIKIELKTIIPSLSGKESITTSVISLSNFGICINLNGSKLIAIYFSEVNFTNTIRQLNGKAATSSAVKINIANVEFDYYLKLIEKLQEVLGLKGFILDIRPGGIQMSMGIRLPTISTGPFTITNASVYAGIILPFEGGKVPSVRFSFAERNNPFTLAAGIFGGRGFVAIETEGKAMKMFEASLEFGGYLGLNLGVASGQAYLMGGIYFRKILNQDPYIEAYIICGGALSIIGIITVSVVFCLALGYQSGVLRGRASVTVSISMLFFSASYTLSFEKVISGASSDIGSNPLFHFPNNLAFHEGAMHGPAVEEVSTYDDEYNDRDKQIYRFRNDPDDKREVQIFDPTVLFSHSLLEGDAATYAKYFEL